MASVLERTQQEPETGETRQKIAPNLACLHNPPEPLLATTITFNLY